MWTVRVRIGVPELLVATSIAAVAGVLAVAFLSGGWTMALVPGLTYALAIVISYVLYQRLAGEWRAVSLPAEAKVTRFQVVGSRGVCPLGYKEGAVLAVDAAGAVSPQLCPSAAAVLRLAAAEGREPEVEEWCCPVFDHLLVFRELKAA